jgi:hypothetical protein
MRIFVQPRSRESETHDKETEVPLLYIYIGGKEVVWLCVCQARCGTYHEELHSPKSRIQSQIRMKIILCIAHRQQLF